MLGREAPVVVGAVVARPHPRRRHRSSRLLGRSDGYGRSVLINVRAAAELDQVFIVEMAREASIIENRPLPAADSEEVRDVLPRDLAAALIAVSADGERAGAAWWHQHDPPLARDSRGQPLPELVVAVRAEDRGHGIGDSLIEALTLHAATYFSAIVLNVHIRNPAARLYSREGFTVLGKGRGPLGVCMRRDLSPASGEP